MGSEFDQSHENVVVRNNHNHEQEREFEQLMRSVMPAIVLVSEKHKGEDGRIGVIGGSEDYTGAPYFAAYTSMKVGADLGHVFCMRNAAIPIKCYSPDLIVLPYLDDAENVMEKADSFLDKMDCLIVGPGLGRDKGVLKTVAKLIEKIKEKEKPVVIDADGLWLIKDHPNLIKGYKHAILTPNKVEANRLKTALFNVKEDDSKMLEEISTKQLAAELGNVTILEKGQTDSISDGHHTLGCGGIASGRRCGGQGDLMCGATATYFHWFRQSAHGKGPQKPHELLRKFGPAICAAFAGSMITRRCNRSAVERMGRAATTSDMVVALKDVMSCYSPGGFA